VACLHYVVQGSTCPFKELFAQFVERTAPLEADQLVKTAVSPSCKRHQFRFHLTSKRERSSHRVPVFVLCVCAKVHEAQVACFFLH
jgi:hypothetical protein